jgi:DeoR family glycerol-3-phosphate regulon repressor
MFVAQRHELILEKLKKKGQVRVKELAGEFGVTEDLIRKDLSTLEQQGKLTRNYGGAVPLRHSETSRLASQKKILNMEAKSAIAKKAFELIQPGMIVYLDISTTNMVLAKQIVKSQLPVTVVTNMLEIMNILAASSTTLVSIGGELDYGREGFIGAVAYETLKNFRFDLAFIGAMGVEPENDALTILTAAESLTKKLVLQNSAKKYVLAENEKINRAGNYQFATLEEVDGIIFDSPVDADTKEILESRQVEVL